MTIPPRKELQEKDFIQDSTNKNPFPMWLWLFLMTALSALFWGSNSYFFSKWQQDIESSPFLQVTNRQFSIFLWQFSDNMRVNSKSKNGYLPGFQYENKVSLVLEDADKYVVAPPSLIFLYHTWERQISNEFTPRSIPLDEFKEFLAYAEEWKPSFWSAAPKGYVQLIQTLSNPTTSENLNDLPESALPIIVRKAFQGWKNYFKEGEEINKLKPTYLQMADFLKTHPHYARNYWRNIVYSTTPHYLVSFMKTVDRSSTEMPQNEITPFLRVDIFNYLKSLTENASKSEGHS